MVKQFAFAAALAIAAFFGTLVVTTAPVMAGTCVDGTIHVSCDTPTGVKKGTKVPVWQVAYCVVGPANGPYTKIDCKSRKAVHLAPTGNQAVCFVGTDNKVHWDYQREVHVGRPFINHRVGGQWQPDWQDARPY